MTRYVRPLVLVVVLGAAAMSCSNAAGGTDAGSVSDDAGVAQPADAGAGDVPCGNGVDDDGNGLIDDGCTCAPGSTQSCYPEATDPRCSGTQRCEGDSEFGAWGPCEEVESCGRPTDACDELPRVSRTQNLDFPSPLATIGQCPWEVGDNLGFEAGAMAARHEVTRDLSVPPGAVLCSASFRVRATDMYYDDWMFILFDDVVVLSPSDWSAMLDHDNGLLVYDWQRIRGQSGGSPPAYCPGAGSSCELPDTQQNGSIVLELDQPTQRQLFDRAAAIGAYQITVAATGDNDPSIDCAHSPFVLEVAYEYVNPGP